MKKLTLKLILGLGGIIAIYLSNGGIENNYLNLIQTLLLICGWEVLVWYPRWNKYYLICCLICLIAMVGLYLIGIIEWSGYFGALGMGLFFLYVLVKIPQLVSKGYISER